MESAWPRTMAASGPVSLRGGSGSRALPAEIPGRSAANETSRSGFLAMARRHPVTARLNGSVGLSLPVLLPLRLDDMRLQFAGQITRRRWVGACHKAAILKWNPARAAASGSGDQLSATLIEDS